MAESICRLLRDGALEGEHAPALTIKDSIASPFGFHVFAHVLSQLSSFILAGKSQSRGLVVVCFSRSPSFYLELLKNKGIDVVSSDKRIQTLDCYSDPLGWKSRLTETGNFMACSHETSISRTTNVFKDVKHMDKLYNSIVELGKGLVGGGKIRFSVAIDSVDEMLRHASMSSVSGLLSKLRSHDQVSSIFWLLHSDLHEAKVTAVLEYLSSMVAGLEPLHQPANGQRGDMENFSLIEHNLKKGKFHVRFKRRNGRVRVMLEEVHVEHLGVNFTALSSEGAINQGLVPKVQFSLQLSEKERIDKANVVLPFEHQGNGKPIQIYDGRRSLADSKHERPVGATETVQTSEDSGRGEIIYYRDSDDEMPDSDEDPDDDLDI
ncbi:elongator complex protein 5 isoform X1 [Durio zibethinus]|uniref:Elongator complex protein 5 n=1 Tax=Durio zibethinus TaxID=66656 RepID=A0A6P6A3D4_DURZI|nr:elongator complex protein 5 isoform X1 [Durio zibethinus]XP_022759256.1 elongator complex protein 5 isoform X1 [Durio zibethinus]XP_022759257.1 elongator complex protein 5 isoform X1 [Durio zibethinus]